MPVSLAVDPSIRTPLDETTNESGTPPPSPPSITAKVGPVLRHKPTNQMLNPNTDSSESYPSPHSSIYEASLIPQSSKDIVISHDIVEAVPTCTTEWSIGGVPAWEDIVADASGSPLPVSFLQPPATRRHTPHELYPITEKSSLATLQVSLRARTSVATLRSRSPGLNGKRQKSFSLSDLPSKSGARERPSPPVTPFLTPAQPQYPPPARTPTPPGLPTFGKPAAVNYRLPPPKSRFRDNFRTPTPEQREYIRQTVGLPNGVIMRGENGVMVRGKFTPIVSGHFPPQRQMRADFRAPNPTHSAMPEHPTPTRLGRNINVHHDNDGLTSPTTATNAPNGNAPQPQFDQFSRVNAPTSRQDSAKKVFHRAFCCWLCACIWEDHRSYHSATAPNRQNGIQRDIQPSSVRARMPPPHHSIQGNGRT